MYFSSIIFIDLMVLVQIGNGIFWFDTFIRQCNDPAILAGRPSPRDPPYCKHACGANTDFMCNPQGICICSLPCYMGAQPRPGALAPDICPPKATDPMSKDPFWPTICQIKCSQQCSGGTGTICGETKPLPDPTTGALTLYGLICTCVCPPQLPCPGVAGNTTTTLSASPATPPWTTLTTATIATAAAATVMGILAKKISAMLLLLKKIGILGWIYLNTYGLLGLGLATVVAVYIAMGGFEGSNPILEIGSEGPFVIEIEA